MSILGIIALTILIILYFMGVTDVSETIIVMLFIIGIEMPSCRK